MNNPFLNRSAAKAKGAHGTRSEKLTAQRLGAQQTPASGALQGAKSDMKRRQYRIEAKATKSASMALDSAWLAKIRHEAVHSNMEPALTVTFTDQQGNPRPGMRWVMISEDEFKRLTENP